MKKIRYNFNLTEVLVATAIFAILMVIVMNIFSVATRTLAENVGNTKISSSAKIALDYIEDMLKNSYRADLFDNAGKALSGGKLFGSGSAHVIEFTSTTNPDFMAFRSVASFEDKNLNEARYGLFGIALDKNSNSPDYGNLLVVFDVNNNGMTGTEAYETDYTTILNNVMGFKMTAYNNTFGDNVDKDNIKYIQIDLEVLSPDDFAKWREMSGNLADDFYNEKVYVFSRIVTLP